MVELRDELDENIAILLKDLESYDGSDDTEARSKMVENVAKLYKIRLDEKKLDGDLDRDFADCVNDIRDRRDKIVDRCVDVGIAVLKVAATVAGYCLVAKMHANSIVADSYGVLQRSASFRIIPNMNPDKNL